MRIKTDLARETTEVETVAAAGIQNDIARDRVNHLRDSAQQRLRHAAIVQTPPRRYRIRSIARILGSPILRLEQVDVPAACDIERMSPWTYHSLFFAR
jgi:hypothetical protein